jgi:hypothetical protein
MLGRRLARGQFGFAEIGHMPRMRYARIRAVLVPEGAVERGSRGGCHVGQVRSPRRTT